MAESSKHVRFASTQWSIVLRATGRTERDDSGALQALCQTYWYPLYAFARRRGNDAASAEDLTQAFFAELIQKNSLGTADPTRGRFRTFLLTLFRRFLTKQQQREATLKRGGGTSVISIDSAAVEQRYALEPADEWTPEALYERRWALQLLDLVMEQLKAEYVGKGQGEFFEVASAGIGQSRTKSDDASAQLAMSASAYRVALHRLRKRYREILHQEIARTLEDPADLESEIACLQNAIRGNS